MARRRYDDKFRASAVVMLEAAGYPDNKGALQRVANHLKMPPSTLHGWVNGSRNPPPSDLRCEKKADLQKYILAELGFVFGEAHNARQDASYRDLMIGFGILVDKLQLLTGEPTSRTENVNRQFEGLLEGLDEHSTAAVIAEAERIVARATSSLGPAESVPSDGVAATVETSSSATGGIG